jgi:hypothetical protein
MLIQGVDRSKKLQDAECQQQAPYEGMVEPEGRHDSLERFLRVSEVKTIHCTQLPEPII